MTRLHDRLPTDFRPRRAPIPRTLLMCPPDHFDVVEVHNPFMKDHAGSIDKDRARAQWEALRATFVEAGMTVELLTPRPDLYDMVFTANPSLTGQTAHGRRCFVKSRMRHASRQPEADAHAEWLTDNHFDGGEADEPFEGGGDAIWQPGWRFLWGGVGPRTDAAAYELVAATFGVPVLMLELATERFYHLDTCFCPIDESTAMIYPPALTPRANELVRAVFRRVIELDDDDAHEHFAGNAAPVLTRTVVLQRGCKVAARLRALHYEVVEVDVSEFLKSGGGPYCLKQYLP